MRIIIFLMMLCSTACYANQEDFNKYMDGALEVYSQFKVPSKEESEKFYIFVQSKWIDSTCKIDCSIQGYETGKEYAIKNKVVIKGKK